MNYAVEQRMRFIDFLLERYGHIGRDELIMFFGISAPQATRDFRAYKELAPQNCVYDVSARRYLMGAKFKPVFNHGAAR